MLLLIVSLAMGTAGKKLQDMRNNPRADWRIEDLYVVAKHWGVEVRSQGGSHHVFAHPDIDYDVSVPAHRPIKPIYIKKFVKLIEDLDERAATLK